MSKLKEAIDKLADSDLSMTLDRVTKILSEMMGPMDIDELKDIIFQDLTSPLKSSYDWDSTGVNVDSMESHQDIIDDANTLGLIEDSPFEKSWDEALMLVVNKLDEMFIKALEDEATEMKYQWELKNKPERYLPEGHDFRRGM